MKSWNAEPFLIKFIDGFGGIPSPLNPIDSGFDWGILSH